MEARSWSLLGALVATEGVGRGAVGRIPVDELGRAIVMLGEAANTHSLEAWKTTRGAPRLLSLQPSTARLRCSTNAKASFPGKPRPHEPPETRLAVPPGDAAVWLSVIRTEGLFREMNERLSQLYVAREQETAEYICECGDSGCTKGIVLTDGEYEAVRRHPTRFAIAVGHEIERIERVVGLNAQFTVVEKPVSA